MTRAEREVEASMRMWRRPALLALVLGCGISFLVSGRLTPRLLVDGALSFAFVPLCQILGFTAVFWMRRSPVRYADAVDRFFEGNTPWLWFLVACMIAAAVLPVTTQAVSLAPLLVGILIPISWSAVIDVTYFRDVLGHTRSAAIRSVIVQRVLAWTAAILYFFGVAIGPLSLTSEIGYLFVEAWQMLRTWIAGLA